MDVEILSETNEVVNTIFEMNEKFNDFLNGEGRWLGGGFEQVFQFRKYYRSADLEIEVKKEVLMMLPKEIRDHIEKVGLGLN
ncbi:hypothetical protein ACS126_16195 [Sphingobacterium lactis]|uniref:hypothetical protein n=1 Tax=Sphingobacterium lactis TaxID=797291 RepID=UPI003EC7DCF5